MMKLIERLQGLNDYCREINIELYGGNDVTKAFEKFWDFVFLHKLNKVSFTCNGHKVTIEKIKS